MALENRQGDITMRYAATLLGLALLAAPAAAAPTATGLSPEALAAPDSIVAQGLPDLPRPDPALLRPYENIRAANLQDWHPTERRLAIRTRFAETTQLHEVAMPLGDRTQVTFYEDRVTGGSYRPGHPDQVLFVVDEGGAENFQFHLLDRRTGRSRLVSDGKSRYTGALWTDDGRLLAYASNARNGRDFDIYVADPAKPGSERRLAEVEGSWTPLDWSRDGRRLLLAEFLSASESYLHWVDVESGKVHAITPRPDKGGATVIYGGGHWAPDGRAVYTTSDRGGEFRQLVRLDLSEKAEGGRPTETVLADIPWDVETADLSDDGSLIAFFVNADGVSRLHLLDLKTGRELPSPDLPEGTAGELHFRPGHRELAFDLEWARSPNDVYTYDPDARRLERWTKSEIGGLDPETFPIPQLVRYPTFDETAAGARRTIPAFVYRPDPGRFPGKRPVFINIHGGPEGQERPDFLGSNNYFVTELGVVYVVPNVRGSSGYGKTFLKLDNGDKREDSVKDIGALLDWIAAQPDLDARARDGRRRLLRRLHGARQPGALQRPSARRLRLGRHQQLRDLPREHPGLPPRPAAGRVRRRARPQDASPPRDHLAGQERAAHPQAAARRPGRQRPARAALGVRPDRRRGARQPGPGLVRRRQGRGPRLPQEDQHRLPAHGPVRVHAPTPAGGDHGGGELGVRAAQRPSDHHDRRGPRARADPGIRRRPPAVAGAGRLPGRRHRHRPGNAGLRRRRRPRRPARRDRRHAADVRRRAALLVRRPAGGAQNRAPRRPRPDRRRDRARRPGRAALGLEPGRRASSSAWRCRSPARWCCCERWRAAACSTPSTAASRSAGWWSRTW